jgi:UDP-N-acetylglucosamine 4-epimerase
MDQAYNIALGEGTTLNELFERMRSLLEPTLPHVRGLRPVYREFRAGDVRLSRADIGKASRVLGYRPARSLADGLAHTIDWYAAEHAAVRPARKVMPQLGAAFAGR